MLFLPCLNTPKHQIFQWMHKILKFSSLTPSYLLKVTKFLVKISQFEFLVMTDKNIFLYKLFWKLHWIFQISFFFLVKLQPPLKKVTLFLTPNQLIRKVDEKDFKRFTGTLKIQQVFKIKDHHIGIMEAGCVCQNCKMFRFDNCDKLYIC